MEAALNGPLGRIVLGPGTLKIGRAADNTLVIQDQQASSHHTEVAPGSGGTSYQVTDMGSTNGTFVNEQRLTPHSPRALNAGDVIRIGQTSMTYEASGASYAPTMAVNPQSYESTMAASDPFAQPAFQQPQAYGNYNAPAQPPYTPPPAYPQAPPAFQQPQPAYPQPQGAYPQAQPFPQAQPAYPQQGYPQQGYPQQPGFGQPGMPLRKKSRAGLWIAIVVILVLVGGGGGFYYFQIRSTPQKTLAAYCDGFKTNNAQEIYDTGSAKDQAQTSVSKIQTGLKALTLLTGGITSCTFDNVQENGSNATASLTVTASHLPPAPPATVHLINENGQWKIQGDSNTP